MDSRGGGPVAGLRLHRLTTWFDTEIAAVSTILLGLFQVLLSAPISHSDQTLPKFFVLPFILGIVIVAGGSLTLANERNPSRLLLSGCACSNALGLLGSLIAFCVYIYTLKTTEEAVVCDFGGDFYHRVTPSAGQKGCPERKLEVFSWSLTLLLLLYDVGAVIMHSLLSVSAFKTLKSD